MTLSSPRMTILSRAARSRDLRLVAIQPWAVVMVGTRWSFDAR